MEFTKQREKVALDILGFYIQSIFKHSFLPLAAPLWAKVDAKSLSHDLQQILGSEPEPLLQHLSLSAVVYGHIYRALKTEPTLTPEIREYSPLGQLSLEELCREMEASYYPRNKIAWLYFGERVGPSKIAEQLGININTVKYHLRYLNKKYPKRS